MSIKVHQYDHSDCGAACLASVASYYKLNIQTWKIRQLAGTDLTGTSAYGLVLAAEKIGFDAKGVEISSKELHELPLPAIAHLNLPEGGHHFVVIYKIGKKSVKIMDPAEGRLLNIPMTVFIEQWTKVVILLMPSVNFKTGNYKTSAFNRLWSLIKPHTSIFIQSGFGALAFSVLGISTAVYIQKLTDFVLVGHNKNLLNLMGTIMLAIIIVQLLLGMLHSWFILRVGQNIDSTLITSYYKHLLHLPQRFFDRMRVGELISRINDAIKIRTFINQVAVEAIVDVLIVIISFLVMAVINMPLALLATTIIPVYLLVFFLTTKANRKVEREKMEKVANLEVQLIESIKNSKTIKQLNAEKIFIEKTEIKLMEVLEQVYKSGKTDILSSYNLLSLNRFLTIIILWIGATSVISQEISPGELMSFFAITSFFTSPISRLLSMDKTMQGALIATDRLFEVLDLEREKQSDRAIANETFINGDIHFKNVDFSYKIEQQLLNNFNLTINKQSITALVGDSGSGKSTIGNLLHLLYPIDNGQIRIGNQDINDINLSTLRQKVGIIPQSIELFTGNFIDNIAVGDPQPDMNRIYQIIDKLQLNEIAEHLSEGLNTWLGENANLLSGGQRQRLAIARALYRNPEILFFDEATSYLDDRNERLIKSIIKSLRDEGKTIIIVAHRMTAIDLADQIHVFERGKIIETGSYHELIHQQGRFSEMVRHHVEV